MLNGTMFQSFEDLFTAWAKAHCDEIDTTYLGENIPKDIFLPDGIISPQDYEKSTKRVLFIAKEANWYVPAENAVPLESIESMFWHREVAFDRVPKTPFSYRLSMLANAIMTDNYSVVDKSHDVLKSVAVMNLNKRGGYSYCVWDTLKRYVEKYQDYIRLQISMISPDLIICCGYDVMWLIKEYNLVSDQQNVKWIYHPSYFAISDSDYLNQLRCAMSDEEWVPLRESRDHNDVEVPVKGIIFDTNKTYSDISTMDMLLGNKVSAYDDVSHVIDSFNIGDYVFFSVKGTGVVAAGKIISDTEETRYPDGLYEKYKVVDFIIPESSSIPQGEDDLKGISWSEIVSVLGHDFFKARTDKRPYLTESECFTLIELLKNI